MSFLRVIDLVLPSETTSGPWRKPRTPMKIYEKRIAGPALPLACHHEKGCPPIEKHDGAA